MSWRWRPAFNVCKQQCKEGWSCALWSAHLFPHAENCMGLAGCFILLKPCLNLPPKCWVHQLNPPQLGAGILGRVSAWIRHLLYAWSLFVQLSIVLRLEYESITTRAAAFHPAVGDHGTSSAGHDTVFAYIKFRACCDTRLCCCWGFFAKRGGNKFVQFSSRSSSKERWVFICLFASFSAETTACLSLALKKLFIP